MCDECKGNCQNCMCLTDEEASFLQEIGINSELDAQAEAIILEELARCSREYGMDCYFEPGSSIFVGWKINLLTAYQRMRSDGYNLKDMAESYIPIELAALGY